MASRLSRSHNLTDMQSPSQDAVTPQTATIAHVGIAVSTLDAGVSFYRDILGMKEVPMQDSDGARIAAFDAGGSLVELLSAESPDLPIGKFVAKRRPGNSSRLLCGRRSKARSRDVARTGCA